VIPQIRELLTSLGEFPSILWFDTPTKDMTPELAAEVVAILNERPKLIWNNRLGGGYIGDTETLLRNLIDIASKGEQLPVEHRATATGEVPPRR
jgi:hypothetical protein